MSIEMANFLAGLICLGNFASGFYLNRPSVSSDRLISDLNGLEKILVIVTGFLFPILIVGLLPMFLYDNNPFFIQDLLGLTGLALICFILGVAGLKLGDRFKSE